MGRGQVGERLQGIRVLDFTQLLPGPFATKRLAEMGAEVMKVEPPGGDPARWLGRTKESTGIVYLANNDHKHTITIDLKTAQGLEQALKIAATVDVVLEGFRPGTADRLGIGYEQIKSINPSIVYCSLTGYGQPPNRLSHLAGHDLNYVATSGLLSQMTDSAGKPIVPRVQFADLIGGLVAVEGILAALLQKARTGQGDYIDVAMMSALQGFLHIHAMSESILGVDDGIHEITGRYVCYHLYETKDRRTMSLAALEEKFWRNFCLAVNRPDWIDHHLAPATDDDPWYREIKALFLTRTMGEWTTLGEAADCCLQPVLTIHEAFR